MRDSHLHVQTSPTGDSVSTGDFDRVAVVGAGLIGSRWAAVFLAAGLDVVVTDPDPGAEARVLEVVTASWPALRRLGRTQLAEPPRPRFTPVIEDAVTGVDWVQENVPDDERTKLAAIGTIDAAAGPSVIIASSTSGIMPSVLQVAAAHPERVLVGHPFNPAHIMPLVEVVGGKQTSSENLSRAMTFYRRLGKRPLLCRVEAPGFIGNRLQEGLIREFFHLVDEGIATTAELDACVSDGPGLRWALFGPAFLYMLCGGTGGIAHMARQFDPARIDDWAHSHYPELSDRLIDELDQQITAQAEGRALAQWQELLDEFLIRVIELKDLLGRTSE